MPSMPEQPPATRQRLLEGEYFEHETFCELDLGEVRLDGKEFYRCTFENCRLQESRWARSKLEACTFRGCDLTRAHLAETALREVRFEGSKLMGIDWSAVSTNPEVAFDTCNLRYCSFVGVSLRRTVFSGCTVLEANFIDVDLSDAEFPGTDLSGSTLRGCTLTHTDFRGATGAFIDPARNRIKGTRVSVESAVLLARSHGMLVAGDGDTGKAERRKSR